MKSGGHAAFAGASNIQGGVTIDLINLNQVTVSPDNHTTSVGPGNRWINVYEKLSPLGLTVIGGRVADVGVGGLILGGIGLDTGLLHGGTQRTDTRQVECPFSQDAMAGHWIM